MDLRSKEYFHEHLSVCMYALRLLYQLIVVVGNNKCQVDGLEHGELFYKTTIILVQVVLISKDGQFQLCSSGYRNCIMVTVGYVVELFNLCFSEL